MNQIQDPLVMNYSRTRLHCKISMKKTRFSASDHEIISDLEELKCFQQELMSKLKVFEKIETNLPLKRKRPSKMKASSEETLETDAASGLALLMLPVKNIKKAPNSPEISQISKENLPHPNQFQKLDKKNILQLKKKLPLKNPLLSTTPVLPRSIFSVPHSNIHVEMSWITQKLKNTLS